MQSTVYWGTLSHLACLNFTDTWSWSGVGRTFDSWDNLGMSKGVERFVGRKWHYEQKVSNSMWTLHFIPVCWFEWLFIPLCRLDWLTATLVISIQWNTFFFISCLVPLEPIFLPGSYRLYSHVCWWTLNLFNLRSKLHTNKIIIPTRYKILWREQKYEINLSKLK